MIINHPKGLAIGARHITVSTCGIVPKILEFSDFPLQINLAISLHAPTDELRNQIMPINKAYPLKELISALEIYLKRQIVVLLLNILCLLVLMIQRSVLKNL